MQQANCSSIMAVLLLLVTLLLFYPAGTEGSSETRKTTVLDLINLLQVPTNLPDGSRPENIVDGNVLTEWKIDPITNNASEIVFSFNLEKGYMLHSISLLSTTQFLPLNWSLELFDGATANRTFQYSNDGVYEQTALLGDEQASHLRLLISLLSMDTVAIGEVIVVISGSDLEEESECRLCLDHLMDILDGLVVVINDSNSAIISSINTALLQQIMDAQFLSERYRQNLLVLSIVLGLHPPLDEGITLLTGVTRLDLQLVPPLPNVLEELRTSIISLESLNSSTKDLALLLEMTEEKLKLLFSNYTELETQGQNYKDMLEQLEITRMEELNDTIQAQMEASRIFMLISRRNYSAEMIDLEQYELMVQSALLVANELVESINEANNQIKGTNVTLSDISIYLQEVIDIATEANSQSNESILNVAMAYEKIQQIHNLLANIDSFDSTLDATTVNISSNLDSTQILVDAIHDPVQSVALSFEDLSVLSSQLSEDMDDYEFLLLPYSIPPSCNLSSSCTDDEIYSEILASNASIIVNSSTSVYTLRHIRTILTNFIETGEFFNFSDINETAIRALQVSVGAINQLSSVNTSSLLLKLSDAQLVVQMLEEDSAQLANATNNSLSRADTLNYVLSQLLLQVNELEQTVVHVKNQTESLTETASFHYKSFKEIFLMAEDSMNRSIETNKLIENAEEMLVDVPSSIYQTRENVQDATEALDIAESKFNSISLFLNETQEVVDQFVFNVSSFISENERIISEIDNIVAGLANIHSRINKINSPVRLVEDSYLSLQPPPGRLLDDSIQFESLDLYLTTGQEFSMNLPQLLFYAGPLYRGEGTEEFTDNTNDQDYYLLTIESDQMVKLQWNIGGTEGSISTPFSLGLSQLHVTRHGPRFQIRYGVNVGEFDSSQTMGAINNGSLLFRTSNRTAYLLGGRPQEAQLGIPNSIIPLGDYQSFLGQIELLLFNGEQWGLWNVRRTSMTSFLGPLQRSFLASANVWRPSGSAFTSSIIAFDGNGYLFVEELANVKAFTNTIRRVTITARNVGERDGLVLYAFDKSLTVSMEVAYVRGRLHVLIRRDMELVLANFSQTITGSSDEEVVSIIYADRGGFRIGNQDFLNTNSIFFTDLTQVQGWYGGIREDLLESPYIPELTTSGFHGCVEVVVEDDSVIPVFRGKHFSDYYLNSKIQKSLSGTCLTSMYTREVGFNGSLGSYLSYTHLTLVKPTNSEDQMGEQVTRTISLSFLAQRGDGILLIAISKELYLTVVLNDQEIMLRIGRNREKGSVIGTDQVKLGVWQHLLIDLGSDKYTLYLDGIYQSSLPSVPGLDFEMNTDVGASNNSVLFVGGGNSEIFTTLGMTENISSFVGCMKDLTYDFRAMSFINPALSTEQQYTDSVTYNTCPFSNVIPNPLLAVHPQDPTGRLCLSTAPPETEQTHGGFHRETRLATSNVIGLLNSSWTLSMSLRQFSDGLVATVSSIEDHKIQLHVRNGQAILSLSGPIVDMEENETEEPEILGSDLKEGVFTPVAISCTIENTMLSCSLLVNGVSVGVLQVDHTMPIFSPKLPLVFGKMEFKDGYGEEMKSFSGCISDLRINNDASGFKNVQTDVKCYNRTESGYGFSGISRLSALLPDNGNVSQTISMEFQPLLDNGLILLLSDASSSLPVLAIGIFNGELRLSNFSDPLSYMKVLDSVCDFLNSYFNLTLTYGGATLTLVVRGGGKEGVVTLPFFSGMEGFLLTIGNYVSGFVVPKGSELFQFLLSADSSRDSLPPGFAGCVKGVMVGGNDISQLSDVSMEQLLIDYCPSV